MNFLSYGCIIENHRWSESKGNFLARFQALKPNKMGSFWKILIFKKRFSIFTPQKKIVQGWNPVHSVAFFALYNICFKCFFWIFFEIFIFSDFCFFYFFWTKVFFTLPDIFKCFLSAPPRKINAPDLIFIRFWL